MATSWSSTSTWMWPSLGLMLRVVWLTIFALARVTSSSAPLARTVAPLRGATIVSLAGLLGRGPSVSELGVAPAPLSPPEHPASAAASAKAPVRATIRCLWLDMLRVVPPGLVLDDLLEAGVRNGSPAWLGVDREGPAAGGQVGVGGEVACAEAQHLQPHRVARQRPRRRLDLADRLLVAVGAEEGEVDLVAPGPAGVGVRLQGAAAGQGDGVDGRLAGDPGHLHLLRRGARLQLHGDGDRAARRLHQRGHAPPALGRQGTAATAPGAVAAPGEVEGGLAQVRPGRQRETELHPPGRERLARVVVDHGRPEAVGAGRVAAVPPGGSSVSSPAASSTSAARPSSTRTLRRNAPSLSTGGLPLGSAWPTAAWVPASLLSPPDPLSSPAASAGTSR